MHGVCLVEVGSPEGRLGFEHGLRLKPHHRLCQLSFLPPVPLRSDISLWFLLMQTPSGLLLAPSPLLSNIHFWSSLSPVGPLSPAQLQSHAPLFQVMFETF